MKPAKTTFVVDGLVEETPDGPQLIGSRCVGCDTLYFPQMSSCPNPRCSDKFVKKALLPREGTLYSYTIQRYQPPPLFRMDNWAPYILGLVEIEEGLRVMGMLGKLDEADVAIGMKVQVVANTLYSEADGSAVATYMFAPVANVQ